MIDPDLAAGWQRGLEDRLGQFAACDLAGLFAPASLGREGGAVEHCTALTRRLWESSHARLRDDPALPPRLKHAVAETWQFMADLYDPASPLSRVYLILL